MESFSERTQTCAFENHANLLAYLANWLLFTPENHFQGTIKHHMRNVIGFAHLRTARWRKARWGLGTRLFTMCIAVSIHFDHCVADAWVYSSKSVQLPYGFIWIGWHGQSAVNIVSCENTAVKRWHATLNFQGQQTWTLWKSSQSWR